MGKACRGQGASWSMLWHAFISASFAFLSLPANTTRVLLNIGSHITPLRPPKDDLSTIVIAFEPVVGCRIRARERLYVVHAAVASSTSFSTMGVYHDNQGSSSLSAPAKSFDWSKKAQPAVIVPVIAMRTVLESIPAGVEIWFMKTDMQGHDFDALVGGGHLLRRVHYLRAECSLNNVRSYTGPPNDFCLNLFPYLTSHGFEFVHMHGNAQARRAVNNWKGVTGHQAALDYCAQHKGDPPRAGMSEGDAFFQRAGARLPPPTSIEWPFS